MFWTLVEHSPKIGMIFGAMCMFGVMIAHTVGAINIFRPPHEGWQTVFFSGMALMVMSVLAGWATI